MGERNLLVIGSQCKSLPRLSFLPDVATGLYQAMTDPDRGACQPALAPSGLVIDPTVAEAKRAIRMAFERAAKAEATLLLAFIGHGEQATEYGDFYVLPVDAEVPPGDDTALNLVNHVKGLRRKYETEGLVVLVDTSYSGTAAVAAAKEWPSMSLGEFRFEFLAATADGPAFDGCFSKNLVQLVQAGMRGGPSDLRCEDVRVAMADRCPNQQVQHMSYLSDPGLFLAHNVASLVREAETSPVREAEAQVVDKARLIVPAITDDAVEGRPDRLGIDADARALAALVASRRLEPPLAIGLYGEWGSGKTFFMKRVQASVKELATSGATEVFCSEVAPVWFSAWQYAEGNLWASLLHHVFASLYPSKSRRQAALDKVMAKVQSAQQVTSAVAEQVQVARADLDIATEAIDSAKNRHQKALQEASQLRTKDLWDAVQISAADQQLKDQVASATADLGLNVAIDSAQDLMLATRQVVDLASQARVLAIAKPWYRSPLAYAFYAAIIIGSLGLLIGAIVHTTHGWIGTAITTIGQLAAVGSAAAAWISRQGSLARRFIVPAEALQRRLQDRLAEQQAKNERELAALEQEADTAKAELALALEQRVAAEQQLAAAEKEQTELTGKRLLHRYLAERASSGDYEHYMGVIALAHRDLVDLEEYLQAAIHESTSHDGLDRIVLYIDDLDRCDPDVVADVLDAVHLLLALRLFVVIVGVDPRWLKRSLRERHPDLLKSTPSGASSASPADYLEKIFQLTYSLPRMAPESCGDLLVAAAQDTQAPPVSQEPQLADDYELSIDVTSLDVGSGAKEDSFGNGIKNDTDTVTDDSGQSTRASAQDLAEALTLRKEDIEALRDVAPLVSISPRRAKRFLNVYLVIRARALGDHDLREHFSKNGDVSGSASDNSLLVLVALLLGLPKTMAASVGNSQLANAIHSTTLGKWLTEAVQAVPEEQARLQAFLNSKPSIAALPMNAVIRWLPIASPYLPLSIGEPQD